MGITERLLAPSAGDLAGLQQLVVDSHWNQLAADWEVFLRAGTVHVVRDGGGRIVASGAVLPMGASEVAWISMILVTPARRGAGLGRAVFGQCLAQVQAEGRIAMLDATPAGEALYAQFGFRAQWRLGRWRREGAGERRWRNAGLSLALQRQPTGEARRRQPAGEALQRQPTGEARRRQPAGEALQRQPAGEALQRQPAGEALQRQPAGEALRALMELDERALGFDRSGLIAQLADRPGSRCIADADAAALVRDGRTARHIGPLLARSESAAVRLLQDMLDAEDATLLVDLRDDRPLLRGALEAAGFRHERPFARMALPAPGQVLPAGDGALLHAVAGPEFA
ncbi:GNAT family N-acetyltransferase [Ramlibacter sp. AN1133]|uniref:GNAT family N-acetyltransferase n=1 Tax=Ramlibacter sp. AN1133 TaxID=3133429 RepID=UPI0030C0EDBE